MSEPYIVIDENRDINVPEELRERIVQFDHNVETFTFQCPRYWDSRDLSTMKIFVNYVIDPKKGTCSAYLVKELNVNEADDNMTFDWVVTQDATTKDGELIIFVCAQLTDELGNLQHHWSSNFNKDFKLAKSYKCLQGIVDNYPNIIGQMLADIDKLKENGGSVTFTYNEATGDVTFGNETVIAAPEGIEAHAEVVSINGRGLQDTVAREKISELSATIADLNGGTPTPVSLVSEMTDTKKVYLYTGTEEGYINGNFYYHDGTTWKSGGRYGGETGITTALQTALLNCFAYVAWTGDKGKELYDALEMELKKVTANIKIIGISATYTGDDVEAGTQLSKLTGITVYVNYSDGSQVVVGSGYELSGEIVDGENTITVTYNGYTTTFKVTGLPSSKVYLTFDEIPTITNKYVDDNGNETANWGNVSNVIDSNQPIYDYDVNVHFRFVINHASTVYSAGSFGSLDKNNKSAYRRKSAQDYYVEGNGITYLNPGNVYEGTYTLKAGCYFVAGLFPLAGSIPNGISDINFTDCYAYIDESEVV